MPSHQSPLSRVVPLSLLLLGAQGGQAQQASDPIGDLVGTWDLVGTRTTIKIHADHTVDHFKFGSGDIRHDNVNYFTISYRQHHLVCRYEIKKYSDDELSFVVAVQPSEQDCDLGVLRRAPGSAQPKDNKSRKGEGKPPRPADGERSMPSTTVFKDCEACPDMVVVPAGDFLMGSPDAEPGRLAIEGPLHKVAFAANFAVGRYAITRDQFMAFVAATGHRLGESCHAEVANQWLDRPNHSPLSPGFAQDGRHPVVCVSWTDANAYVEWLSTHTKKTYRLLTEAEREYVTRAGTATPYWWGSSIGGELANFDERRRPLATSAAESNPAETRKQSTKQQTKHKTQARTSGTGFGGTAAVHKFKPNPWGLFQVHGNVAEWVQDCWNKTYIGAPTDGSAAKTGDCTRRVLRGGAWSSWPEDIRAAYRESAPADHRYSHVGFRVARDLGQ